MKMRAAVILLSILFQTCLLYVDAKPSSIKGSSSKRISRRRAEASTLRRLGVGWRPNNGKDTNIGWGIENGKVTNKGDNSNTINDGNSSPSLAPISENPSLTKGSNNKAIKGNSSGSTLLPASTTPSPPPLYLPTFKPILVPTQASITNIPSLIPTNQMTVSRALLPFSITLEGDKSQFSDVDIALKLSLEFFMDSKMEEHFVSFEYIKLEEIALINIQRQIMRRSFSYKGRAQFDAIGTPCTQEVQDAQQEILLDYIFEWRKLLEENGIFVTVTKVEIEGDVKPPVDISDDTILKPSVDGGDDQQVDPDEALGTGGRNDVSNSNENDDSQLWAILIASALIVFAVGFFVVRRQRIPEEIIHFDSESFVSEDDDEGLRHESDLMIDTSCDTQTLTWEGIFRHSIGKTLEEFEDDELNPEDDELKPETEFMTVPGLEDREVVRLQTTPKKQPTIIPEKSSDIDDSIYDA